MARLRLQLLPGDEGRTVSEGWAIARVAGLTEMGQPCREWQRHVWVMEEDSTKLLNAVKGNKWFITCLPGSPVIMFLLRLDL
jgi:hypothetical protein